MYSSRLTWRDVQYLIVYTSNADPLLTHTDDYFVNGAGLTVSHHFGFGSIDGEAMVTRAQQWINVPSQMNDIVIPLIDSGYYYTTSTYINTALLAITIVNMVVLFHFILSV